MDGLIASFEGDHFTAIQAANHFARTCFDEPRRASGVDGRWSSAGYSGWFRLVDGAAVYLLTYTHGLERWEVRRSPETEA